MKQNYSLWVDERTEDALFYGESARCRPCVARSDATLSALYSRLLAEDLELVVPGLPRPGYKRRKYNFNYHFRISTELATSASFSGARLLSKAVQHVGQVRNHPLPQRR